ncbi:MAG: hypothetical protein IJV71_00615 [Lachnospiraceae bacterium]|nr:hypothetical protein [Lachnospiraceae bacterium]
MKKRLKLIQICLILTLVLVACNITKNPTGEKETSEIKELYEEFQVEERDEYNNPYESNAREVTKISNGYFGICGPVCNSNLFEYKEYLGISNEGYECVAVVTLVDVGETYNLDNSYYAFTTSTVKVEKILEGYIDDAEFKEGAEIRVNSKYTKWTTLEDGSYEVSNAYGQRVFSEVGARYIVYIRDVYEREIDEKFVKMTGWTIEPLSKPFKPDGTYLYTKFTQFEIDFASDEALYYYGINKEYYTIHRRVFYAQGYDIGEQWTADFDEAIFEDISLDSRIVCENGYISGGDTNYRDINMREADLSEYAQDGFEACIAVISLEDIQEGNGMLGEGMPKRNLTEVSVTIEKILKENEINQTFKLGEQVICLDKVEWNQAGDYGYRVYHYSDCIPLTELGGKYVAIIYEQYGEIYIDGLTKAFKDNGEYVYSMIELNDEMEWYSAETMWYYDINSEYYNALNNDKEIEQ